MEEAFLNAPSVILTELTQRLIPLGGERASCVWEIAGGAWEVRLFVELAVLENGRVLKRAFPKIRRSLEVAAAKVSIREGRSPKIGHTFDLNVWPNQRVNAEGGKSLGANLSQIHCSIEFRAAKIDTVTEFILDAAQVLKKRAFAKRYLARAPP
jgi:hypothetical protein